MAERWSGKEEKAGLGQSPGALSLPRNAFRSVERHTSIENLLICTGTRTVEARRGLCQQEFQFFASFLFKDVREEVVSHPLRSPLSAKDNMSGYQGGGTSSFGGGIPRPQPPMEYICAGVCR